MTLSGEISSVGRIFSRDPETQVIYRVEPFAEFTRAQYLACHGGFPSIPQSIAETLQKILDGASHDVAVHEVGHVVAGLHHGRRVISVHLPVDVAEIALTEFYDSLDTTSPDAWQDILAAGCAGEAVALGRSSHFTSGIDRERMERRFPSNWDAALLRAVTILERHRRAFDAMIAALRDARELKEPDILRIWRAA